MDMNALFARAERAFAAGQHMAARADLMQVLKIAGPQPAILHLIALNEAKAGDISAARAAFSRALAAAPRDAKLHNNFANFLKKQGETDSALRHYDEALRLAPSLHQARLNRAILHNQAGRQAEARADIERLRAVAPDDVAVLQTSGAIDLAMGNLEAAAAAFDEVLARQPDDLRALHGRARVAMIAGAESNAIALYWKALAQTPDDPELLLGLAEALEAAGEPGAQTLLEKALDRAPAWSAGHVALVRMRAEAGAGQAIDDRFRAAVASHPHDRALALAHVQCLHAAERPAAALAALDALTTRGGRDAASDGYELMLATELGDIDRARMALSRLPAGSAPLARARFALRTGAPEAAARLLEPLVHAQPGAVTFWAHLDLAWRLMGDQRHDWLSGQANLVATQDIDFQGDWQELANVLRTLHHASAHPIGQSLRGGTQTRGRLFGRPERPVVELFSAIKRAVERHIEGLPAFDERHPLLRQKRDGMRFSGSWSVRLTDGGFHVAHIHPEGQLSSACYIVLPDGLDDPSMPGWLEVGGPPSELCLDLKPLHLIRPQPGRLALFPSTMFHGTRPFPAGERMTVAFDVVLG